VIYSDHARPVWLSSYRGDHLPEMHSLTSPRIRFHIKMGCVGRRFPPNLAAAERPAHSSRPPPHRTQDRLSAAKSVLEVRLAVPPRSVPPFFDCTIAFDPVPIPLRWLESKVRRNLWHSKGVITDIIKDLRIRCRDQKEHRHSNPCPNKREWIVPVMTAGYVNFEVRLHCALFHALCT